MRCAMRGYTTAHAPDGEQALAIVSEQALRRRDLRFEDASRRRQGVLPDARGDIARAGQARDLRDRRCRGHRRGGVSRTRPAAVGWRSRFVSAICCARCARCSPESRARDTRSLMSLRVVCLQRAARSIVFERALGSIDVSARQRIGLTLTRHLQRGLRGYGFFATRLWEGRRACVRRHRLCRHRRIGVHRLQRGLRHRRFSGRKRDQLTAHLRDLLRIHVAERVAQAANRARVQLRDARLVDADLGANLLHRHFAVVVEADHLAARATAATESRRARGRAFRSFS